MNDKLHTDALQEKYGTIHAIVLRHDNIEKCTTGMDCLREAKLVDANNILRTYALTFLNPDTKSPAIATVNDAIRRGGLIGETFRHDGYTIQRKVTAVFTITLPSWLQKEFATQQDKATTHVIEFYVQKENKTPILYGTILEVYSPDFIDPKKNLGVINSPQSHSSTGLLYNQKLQRYWENSKH